MAHQDCQSQAELVVIHLQPSTLVLLPHHPCNVSCHHAGEHLAHIHREHHQLLDPPLSVDLVHSSTHLLLADAKGVDALVHLIAQLLFT